MDECMLVIQGKGGIMNLNIIKERINDNLGKKVIVSVYGLRNRVNKYEGVLYKTYPNIFTILINNGEKSFNYRDVITGEVKIKYM